MQNEEDQFNNWLKVGSGYLSLQNFEEALHAFNKALELKQDAAEVCYLKGVSLYRLKRYHDVLEQFEKIMEFPGNKLYAWRLRGIALSELGRYAEAIEAFDKDITLNPDKTASWTDKGIALENLKRHEEALMAFKTAEQLYSNDNPVGQNEMSSDLYRLLNKEEIKDADKEDELTDDSSIMKNDEDPRQEEAQNETDMFQDLSPSAIPRESQSEDLHETDRMGSSEEILKTLNEIFKADSEREEVILFKGHLYQKLGHKEEALKAFDRAIEIQPENETALKYKINLQIELGRYYEVLGRYDKEIELNPKGASIYQKKGDILVLLNQLEDAIKTYDKAEELNPDNENYGEIKFKKAQVYSLKKDKKNMLKFLSEAVNKSSAYRYKAEKNENFINFWDDDDFKKIISSNDKKEL
ncbi:tetratricopeptide repeat protein [Acidobacteriota bacterium]